MKQFDTSTIIIFVIGGIGIGWCLGLMATGSVNLPRQEPTTKTFRVSAYCQNSCCCGKFADGITASGHKIKPGDAFVAAAKGIPFGTMVTIPGYANGQPVPVLDRGGAIGEGKLDVFFDDDPETGLTGHQRALNWGVQYLEVTFGRGK